MHQCKCYALNAIHQFQKVMCVLITKMWKGEFTLTKKNVLISFVTDADSDLEAVFALNKIFAKLSENELEKFNAFQVLEVVE